MIRQKLLEKALNDACTYIHDDGYNGCPGNYDNKTVTNGKMKECCGCYLSDRSDTNDSITVS